MKPRVILRIALSTSLLVACADVYSTDFDLDVPATPGGSNFDGGTVVTTGPLSPAPPPLCPDAIKMDAGDADGGSSDLGGCNLPSAVCEYGTSPDRNCNTVYSCPSFDETWRELPGEKCAAATECPKNVPSSALEGLPCGFDGGVAESDELQCNVSDGVCACTTGRGGTDEHPRRWVCTKPLAACPLIRPNQGQPCQTGLLCDYGSCRSKRGLAMSCVDGVWAATTLDCSL